MILPGAKESIMSKKGINGALNTLLDAFWDDPAQRKLVLKLMNYAYVRARIAPKQIEK